MTGLVRNHRLIRALPKTAVAAAATASVGFNLMVFESLRTTRILGLDRGNMFELMVLVGGLYVLALNETGLRSARWAQSLPVRAEALWTGHVHALLVAFSTVVLAMAAVVVGFTLLINRFDPLQFVTPQMILIRFARPWLILLAVALVLGSWRPACADPHHLKGWGRARLATAAGAVVALVVLGPLPLTVAVFPVIAAGIWARRVKGRLPAVLSLAERAEPDAPAGVESIPRHGGWVVHWLVLRQLFKWPLTWILGIPMTFLLGLVQGGGFSTSGEADFLRYFNLWISVYLMIAFVGHFLDNLYRLDHLPLPRSILFRWLIVPNLVALLAGGVLGHLIDRARPAGEDIGYRSECCGEFGELLVPVDLWRPVWGDPPATITAPWGETVPAARVLVLPRLPLYMWKPYTTSEKSSADFVAWQISRAAHDAYGLTFDPDVIKDRYLTTGTDGSIRAKEGGLTLRADYLTGDRRALGPILGLLMAFTVNATLATLWIIFTFCGPGASRRRTRTVFWVAMGTLLALHMGGYALLMGQWIREWTLTGLLEGSTRRLADVGAAGWALPWVGGGLLAWALWRACLRAFARVEAVRSRPSGGS